jgi:hypothetical protein
MADPTTLGEVADLVRSKNAGPFWQTLDVFFDSIEAYKRTVASGAVTPAAVSELYKIPADDVAIFEMPHINVIKISFPRLVPAGSFEDRDMHAGQQHVPLTGLPVPVG